MSDVIYLDYNATTPVDPDVLQSMIPYFLTEYGNPSNKSHRFGWAADEAVLIAREQCAALIGAKPDEIIFTGGATEAVNLAIKGVAQTHGSKGKHIITCATEHDAVLESCRSLQAVGYEISVLPVDGNGQVEPDKLAAALRDDTILVALMWANNETGVIHPIDQIVQILASHPALFLTDATQAIGKVPVSVEGIDLLACSAHKFYGPKGVGALYVREKRPSIRFASLIHGGSQESGHRAGTLNVPGIVGLGAAAAIAAERVSLDNDTLSTLRDGFEESLSEAVRGVSVNGANAPRLPQTSNISFANLNAGEMIADIGKLAVSTGSACGTGQAKPSHVLTAHGLDRMSAQGSVRFSLGRNTTLDDLKKAVQLVSEYVNNLHDSDSLPK